MILAGGISSEPPLRLVVDAAASAGIPCVVFNQREAHNDDLSLQYRDNRFEGIMRIRGEEYSMDQFSGVYVRLMDYAFLPEVRRDKIFTYVGDSLAEKSALIHQQFLEWLEIAPCRVLNRPSDMLSNMSKPYQYQIIAKAGFHIPDTCITNDERVAGEFRLKHENIIFKSISSVRSIVQELGPAHDKHLQRIRYLPTQFQERLNGLNIRVHVVGDAVFATKADSGSVDYRYAGRENNETVLSPYELPEAVRERCLVLSRALCLPLCGIDLFLTEDDDYYCFEVNPSPGYSYFQAGTGQDIAGAIVKYLEFGEAPG